MNFIVLDANSGNSHPPGKAARVATLEIPSAPARRSREGRKSSLQRDFRGGDERASKLGAYSPADSESLIPGYANWIGAEGDFPGEPNNLFQENYLIWNHASTALGVNGRVGLWNDQMNNSPRCGAIVAGYLVEYGE